MASYLGVRLYGCEQVICIKASLQAFLKLLKLRFQGRCPCVPVTTCITERFHVRGETDGAVYREKPLPQEQQFANTDGAALKAVKMECRLLLSER